MLKKSIRFLAIIIVELSLLGPIIKAQTQDAGSVVSIYKERSEKPAISTNIEYTLDFREEVLKSYLKSKNSPLTEYSGHFISEADQNGLDWRLLPAITGIESNFGKILIPASYNAYGWGGGYIYFNSWEDGISKVAKGINKNWIARGLDTPSEIAPSYCPPNQVYWTYAVDKFMKEISETPKTPEIIGYNYQPAH
jgi:hypothetical protein